MKQADAAVARFIKGSKPSQFYHNGGFDLQMATMIKRCISIALLLLLTAGVISCGSDRRAQSVQEQDLQPYVHTEAFGAGAQAGADISEARAEAPPGALSEAQDGRGQDIPLSPAPGSEADAGERASTTLSEPQDPQDPQDPQEPANEDALPAVPPPSIGLIDAHADTITRALLRDQDMFSNSLHVDFERLSEYGAPVQVFALWCADRYVENAFDYTNSLIDFFESEVEKHSDIIGIALSLEDIVSNARNNKISAVLSIEGGEALMGNLENLDHFYSRGVRIISLTWNRENDLGYGQATGSLEGLKPFGEQCIRRMEELGIILDVSHLNEAGFWDAHRISARPYMASHSNAYSLTPHNRNLTDGQIEAIVGRGGVIGLTFYPEFLSQGSDASISDIFANISHFIDLGAGGNIGFGSDFDGFNTMPEGLTDVSSFGLLRDEISDIFGESMSTGLMFGNFYDFFVRYFGS